MMPIPFHLQGEDPEQQASLTAIVRRLRGRDERLLVCVDLGSTPRMGLLPEPAHFVDALLQALRAAQCCGLLLTGGYTPLAGVLPLDVAFGKI